MFFVVVVAMLACSRIWVAAESLWTKVDISIIGCKFSNPWDKRKTKGERLSGKMQEERLPRKLEDLHKVVIIGTSSVDVFAVSPLHK